MLEGEDSFCIPCEKWSLKESLSTLEVECGLNYAAKQTRRMENFPLLPLQTSASIIIRHFKKQDTISSKPTFKQHTTGAFHCNVAKCVGRKS